MSWEIFEEPYDYLSGDKFKGLITEIKRLKNNGWNIPKLIACIYDLWNDYILSDEQEEILYTIVDPKEKYNNVEMYYNNMDYDNPLRKILF